MQDGTDQQAVEQGADDFQRAVEQLRRNRRLCRVAQQQLAQVLAGAGIGFAQDAGHVRIAGCFGQHFQLQGAVGGFQVVVDTALDRVDQCGVQRFRPGGDFGHQGKQLLQVAADDGSDDVVLAGEEMVNVAGAHAGGAADLRHAGPVVAVPAKAVGRGIENLLAAGFGQLWIVLAAGFAAGGRFHGGSGDGWIGK